MKGYGCKMQISKSITDWYLGNNRENVKETPKTGFKRVLYFIWNYSGKLFLVNLFFVLCSIPIITIPAALCGLNRYLIKMYKDGYGFEFMDFFREFRSQLIKSIPIGIPSLLLLFYGSYLLLISGGFQNGEQTFFVRTVALVCLALAVLFGNFCFMLLAAFDLPSRHIIKNALILMVCEWKSGFCALLSVLFLWGMLWLFFPVSIVFPLLGCFAVTQLAVCGSIFPAIYRKIIEPYENL
jgi:uncharacterized membrane protein YesL